MAFLFPSLPQSGLNLKQMLQSVDGVLMTGGVDIAPETYGETALQPEWAGDRGRDEYEIAVLRQALELEIPVLGVCRGAQVMNVALGGTMYQDITTQVAGSLVHRNWDIYEHNYHSMAIEPGTGLAKLYPGVDSCKINSVHHQGIKDLGKNLIVEARSVEDGIIEAIRLENSRSYCFGVQWHPEMQDPGDKSLLNREPIIREFLQAVQEKADAKR